MAREIERKFLVKNESWRESADAGTHCLQGYLSLDRGRVVRVRIKGGEAFLTIKGERVGYAAPEFEYPIPLFEANEMLERLCLRPLIDKVRYRVPHAGLVWEVDVFARENEGLVLAEVELESEQQDVLLPSWAGLEVSDDPRYSNASLVRNPFQGWSQHSPTSAT